MLALCDSRIDKKLQDNLADILIRLANEHPSSDIDSLLPWNWAADEDRLKVESSDEYIEQKIPQSS